MEEGGSKLGLVCVPVIIPHLTRFGALGSRTSLLMHLTAAQDQRAWIYVCLHRVWAVTSGKLLILTVLSEFQVK